MNPFNESLLLTEENGIDSKRRPQPSDSRLKGRGNRPRKARLRRKIEPIRFRAVHWNSPFVTARHSRWSEAFLAVLIASGIATGAFWPQRSEKPEPKEEIFVFEEEFPPPTPIPPPPPPDPEPPPPKVEPPVEQPPPPQFGMEKDALSETGKLAVATGNTLMKVADSVVAPPLPPLPPVPVFVDQPPGIVKGEQLEYPLRALDRGLEGMVVVLITIDTAGRVTRADIERSAGKDFDEAVLKAAQGTLFHPPVRQGRRVPAKFRRLYEFRLEE